MSKELGIKGQLPSIVHKIKLSIATNGFTKFLKVIDVLEDGSELPLVKKESEEEIKMKIWEINVCSVTASFVHCYSELMTIFMSKI